MPAAHTVAAEERALLIRALHDQIAHAVSEIHIHAVALQAQHHLPGQPSVDAIREACTAAMHDLRRMYTVLGDEQPASYRPQPDLRGLRELLERRIADPQAIRIDTGGRTVPPSIAAATHRVVREVANQLRRTDGADLTAAEIAVRGQTLVAHLAVGWTALRSPRVHLDLGRARVRLAMLGGSLELLRARGRSGDRWTITIALPLDTPG